MPPSPRPSVLRAGPLDGIRLTRDLRDEARALGKYDAAISAEHKRGQALGYYISRSESGAPGTFTAKTREEADKQLEEVIARIAAKQAIEKAAKV